MNILDWEYYNSHFPKLNQDDFKKVVYHATVLTFRHVTKEFDNLNDSELVIIKDCICNVINTLSTQTDGNIASVSNDGYSVSYVQKTKEQLNDDLEEIFDTWLGVLNKNGFICF